MQAKSGLNTLTLELLRKCPNQCLHCSTLSSPKATDFISLEESKRIIEEAKELGLKKVILSGGEPLIYNELIPLLSFLKSKNLEVVIYTSGSILDSSNCIDFAPKALLEQISKLGVVRYNLSIHSSNCDSHDSFMNTQGSWEKSIQFLEICKNLKQDVHIHTVLSSFNFDNIIELSTFLAKKGVSVLRILKLVPQGRALKNYEKLKTNDIQESIFWGQVKKINEEKLIDLKLGAHLYSLSNNTEYVCSLDSEKMTITPDGTFSVCPAFKGLSKILNSPKIGSENISSVVSSEWRNKISNYKTEFKHTCPAQELYENLINQKKKNITMSSGQISDKILIENFKKHFETIGFHDKIGVSIKSWFTYLETLDDYQKDDFSLFEYVSLSKETNKGKKDEDKILEPSDLWNSVLQGSIEILKRYDLRENPTVYNTSLSKKPTNDLPKIEEIFSYYKKAVEFEKILYGSDPWYRDHFAHVLRVWLLGIYIVFELENEIDRPSFDVYKDNSSQLFTLKELFAAFSISALTHDLGYSLQKIQKLNKKLSEILNSFGGINWNDINATLNVTRHDSALLLLKLLSSKITFKRIYGSARTKSEKEKGKAILMKEKNLPI